MRFFIDIIGFFVVMTGLFYLFQHRKDFNASLRSPPEYSLKQNVEGLWVVDEWEGYGYRRVGFYATRDEALAAIHKFKAQWELEQDLDRKKEWY